MEKKAFRICIGGAVISAALFVASICWLNSVIKDNPAVDVKDADISVTQLIAQNSSVKLSWKCDNAALTSYQIFRQSENEKTFTYYDTAPMYEKYYTDNGAENGHTYGYRVRAYDNRKDTDRSSKLTEEVYIYYDSSQERNPDLTNITPIASAQIVDEKVQLTWEPVANTIVTSVCIYYKNADNKWEVAKVVSPMETSYEETARSDEYKIVVRNTLGEETIRSKDAIVSLDEEVQVNE